MANLVISGSVKQKEVILNLKDKLEKMGYCVETPNFNPGDKTKEELRKDHIEKIEKSDGLIVVLKDSMIPMHTIGDDTRYELKYCVFNFPMTPIFFITPEEVNKRWFK